MFLKPVDEKMKRLNYRLKNDFLSPAVLMSNKSNPTNAVKFPSQQVCHQSGAYEVTKSDQLELNMPPKHRRFHSDSFLKTQIESKLQSATLSGAYEANEPRSQASEPFSVCN